MIVLRNRFYSEKERKKDEDDYKTYVKRGLLSAGVLGGVGGLTHLGADILEKRALSGKAVPYEITPEFIKEAKTTSKVAMGGAAALGLGSLGYGAYKKSKLKREKEKNETKD